MKINIGRYLPSNSIIHRLDARVKLFANIAFIVLFFLADTFVLQAILLFPLLISFIVATKKPSKLIRMLKLPLWIGVFIFLINCFVLKTSENVKDWVNWKDIFKINKEIVITSINIVVRVYSIILTMTILTLSTPPVLLTKALEFYFMPLKWMKIPVNIVIMIISIALRFVPTLVDEAQRILKAQASRGMDFRNGNIRTKVKATIVLIVPLFVLAFSKAEDLANTMETRGYNPYAKRTSYKKWNNWWFDGLAIIAILSIVVISGIIIGGVFQLPDWWLITKNTF